MTHKIFLIGGTGGVGKIFMNMALEESHSIVLYARNPKKAGMSHPNLSVVKGELHESENMATSIKGCDVALITAGVMERKKNTILSDGTRNLIFACKEAQVNKLIAVTSIGLGDSKDQALKSFMYFVVPLFIKHAFADKARQEKLIMDSGLDWIIVRPASLTNGERTGVYRYGRDKKIRGRVSRADTADLLLNLLDDDTYLHQAICQSY